MADPTLVAKVFSSDYSIQSIMDGISRSLPEMTALVTSLMYIVGFWIIFRSVYGLREAAESKQMMSQKTGIFKPIMGLIAGGALVFFPQAIHMAMGTFYAQTIPKSIISYTQNIQSDNKQLVTDILRFIQFIGLVAFFRGWIIISNLGEQSQAQGSGLGKALTHLIGGTLAMNIVGTIDILKATFGSSGS